MLQHLQFCARITDHLHGAKMRMKQFTMAVVLEEVAKDWQRACEMNQPRR